MTLNPVNQGENKYCGPAVLSSITGISTDEAERIINSVRNVDVSRKVTGVWANELRKALEILGWKSYDIPKVGRRSIFSCMMTMNSPGVYLFYIPHHVLAIEIGNDGKRYILDNHTKKALSLSNSARLGQRVLAVVKVEKV